VHGDVRDSQALRTLSEHDCRAVIHFAGLIEVGRSVVGRPVLRPQHLRHRRPAPAMREAGRSG
jgi:hypothetical protein